MTLAELTPAQRTVAERLAAGEIPLKELAFQLGITPKTLSVHAWTVYKRTGTHGRVQLANWIKGQEIAEIQQIVADRDARIVFLMEMIQAQAEALLGLRGPESSRGAAA